MIEFMRLNFRPIEATVRDAEAVVRWRNSDSARSSFFNNDVVTTDTHLMFVRDRKAHNIVWMAEDSDGQLIGQVGLIVDVKNYSAEFGQFYVDDLFRGRGYGQVIDLFGLHYGFDRLNLKSMWLQAFRSNENVISLYRKLGWTENGKNLGHERGEIVVMDYTHEQWNKAKAGFGL